MKQASIEGLVQLSLKWGGYRYDLTAVRNCSIEAPYIVSYLKMKFKIEFVYQKIELVVPVVDNVDKWPKSHTKVVEQNV